MAAQPRRIMQNRPAVNRIICLIVLKMLELCMIFVNNMQ